MNVELKHRGRQVGIWEISSLVDNRRAIIACHLPLERFNV